VKEVLREISRFSEATKPKFHCNRSCSSQKNTKVKVLQDRDPQFFEQWSRTVCNSSYRAYSLTDLEKDIGLGLRPELWLYFERVEPRTFCVVTYKRTLREGWRFNQLLSYSQTNRRQFVLFSVFVFSSSYFF